MATPNWSAARAGLLGDPGAVNASAQINQLLGAHGITPIYQGKAILTPDGTGGGFTGSPLNQFDKSQPFTMVGTTIGRVAIPMIPFGNGADLIVSLCTDNAGNPSAGAPIAQTRVPASWFNELASYTALNDTSPVQLVATDSPLATPSSNVFTMGSVGSFNFAGGTPSGGGFGTSGSEVVSNGTDTIVVIGGMNAAGTWTTNVFTISYEGTNSLANMLPQPSLPIGLGAGSGTGITTDPSSGTQYVTVTGGQTGASGSYSTLASVYVSQLSGTNSQMSAWTTQASLPFPLQTHAAAGNGNFIYITGGVNGSNQVQNGVYYASVQNGQISNWIPGPVLPVGVYDHFTACVNGFLFVIAGFTVPGNTGATNAVWYAPINSDGSLGAWQAGPSVQTVNAGLGTYFTAGSDGIILRGNLNQGLWSLTVGPTGPCQAWQEESFPGVNSGALLANGPGQYYWFEGFTGASTSYTSAGFIVCPYLSVPLPATGLTNGATYHILFQQPTGKVSLTDYISNVFDSSSFPGNPLQLTRPRGGTAWTQLTSAVPLTIYDQSTLGPLWHLYDDGGARFSTAVWATTPNQNLQGYLEAAMEPGPILNQAPTFANGFPPWGVANGTAVQSSAFTYNNLPVSMLLTPTGGFTQAYIECEQIVLEHQQSYTAGAWVYSPTGYSNCVVIINWYDVTHAFISASTGTTTSVAAGTWTFLTTVGGTTAVPPNIAVYGTMGVYERGTPPNTALLYIATGALQAALGRQASTVAQVQYGGLWPNASCWPPLSVTELA